MHAAHYSTLESGTSFDTVSTRMPRCTIMKQDADGPTWIFRGALRWMNRERTTPVAETPIIPPKTKHQRQSELRMIWRNKGVEGVQSIFVEKCSPSGKPPAAAMAPAEMIQAILDVEIGRASCRERVSPRV